MSVLSLRVIATWLECFQEKSSWCRNKQVCQGRKTVKSFERSNELDTALYKNYLYIFLPLSLQYKCSNDNNDMRMVVYYALT